MLLANEELTPPSYELMVKRLAVESTVVSNVISVFRNLLPKSAEMIQSYIPNLTKLVDPVEQKPAITSKLHKDIIKALDGYSFLVYESTLVAVPEGFNGKLIPYLQLLLSYDKKIIEDGRKVLADYNLQLSMFLSNADIRISLKSHADTYKRIRKEREDRQKQIQQFFDSKFSTLSRRPLNKVIDRFADLDIIFTLGEKLDQSRKGQDYKVIASDVQKTTDLLALINQRMEQGDIANVSGQTAKNLAEGAYEVAKYVEAIALYGYYVETAVGSTNNIAEQLRKLFVK